MSSLSASNQGNLKHVMRTALVGIKPADQVILKGYLRVLLRLEADLEWVSANHPDVDLFFVSHEFRHADNVVKLLSKQAQKPALYVKRSTTGEGSLNGDELSLPLKKMEVLNQWLYANVALLGSTPNPQRHTSQSSDNDAIAQTPSSSQTSIHRDLSNQKDESNQSHLTNQAQTSATDTQKYAQTHQPIIRFIKHIHQPQADSQQILLSGEIIATVDTKRQVVWQEDANIRSLFANKLTSIGLVSANSEPTGQPTDLKQWLWDNLWADIDALLPLVSDSATYKLRYWVKPSNGVERRDLLRIMTAMENGKKNVSDIADISGTSPMVTRQVLAGLLFAGYLDTSAYQTLTADAQTDTTESQSVSVNTQPQVAHNNASPLDAVLSQRASGVPPRPQPTSTISPSLQSKQPSQTAKPEATEKTEKMGFLARLRRKLGL